MIEITRRKALQFAALTPFLSTASFALEPAQDLPQSSSRTANHGSQHDKDEPGDAERALGPR